jgi:hypothetical protein
MKKNTKHLLSMAVFLALGQLAWSQKNVVASGGNVSGSSGSVSYTYGQIDYISATGSNGALTQGVQQPYEILTISVEDSKMDYEMSLFPNPSNDFVFLKIEHNDLTALSFKLSNILGQTIQSKNINQNLEEIDFSKLTGGSYLLNVIQGNEIIKSFKIIKK